MREIFYYIRHSLALKVGLNIVLHVIFVFLLSLGFLFVRSRQLVRQEAFERAALVLEKTSNSIVGCLNGIEEATHNMERLFMSNPTLQGALCYSRQMVDLFPDACGCTISLENGPLSRFSVSSVRENDSVFSECKATNYYEKAWYRQPKATKRPCWVGLYNDNTEGITSNLDMMVSYNLPLCDDEKHLVGGISTNMSLSSLSKVVSTELPYSNSYCFMMDRDGRYCVHPDTTRNFSQTIYQYADAKKSSDIIVLAHEIFSGKRDYMRVSIGEQSYFVFYQPVPRTEWYLALVCPESDIMGGYNRLEYMILILISVGLLLIFYGCIRTMNKFIAPLNLLVSQSKYITSGHFNMPMNHTIRQDLVGQLQNSFSDMQHTLNEHVNQLQRTNEKAEQRNKELIAAGLLAKESGRRKQLFIQDVSHQIRTPLNIIQGFLIVLRDGCQQLSPEERTDILDTMYQNATSLRRMAYMLVDASWLETDAKLDCLDVVGCNDIAREAIDAFNNRPPYDVILNFETDVPDSFHITTNRNHLFRILCELLYNAKKYAANELVRFRLTMSSDSVFYIIEDRGPGIPAAERDRVFNHFLKLNSFSEGLGLGLNLSRRFAQKMGGELTLDSSYTDGCRFLLKLPL